MDLWEFLEEKEELDYGWGRYHKQNSDKWSRLINRLETRKVVFPIEVMLDKEESIREALRFEELYILSKKEMSDLFMESETARLTRLKMRS